MPLILASTSVYRIDLLKKLGIPFQTQKPQYDEDAAKKYLQQQKASPTEIAETLSRGKANSIDFSNTTVIAGDQLVNLDGVVLGKPHTFDKAFQQMESMQGKMHELITAVTILNGTQIFHLNHVTRLHMRALVPKEIKNYLLADQPYDCAGSYKIEKGGISLFEKIETDDFTAIQGLPLIWITHVLKELKYEFFQS